MAVQKKVTEIARDAIKHDVTLRWIKNSTFDWQQSLESLHWIPPKVLEECKANFVWLSANVQVSTSKISVERPGFSKFGPPRRNVSRILPRIPVRPNRKCAPLFRSRWSLNMMYILFR